MSALYFWILAFIHLVDHWQTLVAGMLALCGAGFTVWIIKKQIKQAADQEKQRLRREEQAAKAVLPLALAELAQYAGDCIRAIAPYVPASGESPEFPADFVAPRIPEGTVEPLRESARYANADVATQIRVMVGKLQVQHSRLEIARQHARQGQVQTLPYNEGIRAIIDAAELHVLIGDLLLYARERSADPLLTFRRRLLSLLSTVGLSDHSQLIAAIDRHFP